MAIVPTTLQNIITAARLRCDMRTSQFLADTEFTYYINESLAQLDSILISKYDAYKITPILTTCIANTNNIAIPDDFVKFRGLDVLANANNDGYIKVKPCAFQHRDVLSGSRTMYGPFNVTYTLLGQDIVILPAQIAGQYTYRLWYIPDYIQLVNTTDTLQPYMDSQMWYQYAVAEVATKVLTMQGITDEAGQMQQQAEMLRDNIIRLSAPNRDAGDPKAVVDSRDSNSGWGGGYGWNW